MNITRVFLNAKEEKEILQGFPWVFDNEISYFKIFDEKKQTYLNYNLSEKKGAGGGCTLSDIPVEDGSVVEVFSKAGGFLGSGIINKKSKITVRFLTSEHSDELINNAQAFFEKRILQAWNLRQLDFSEKDSFRLVYGEADFIPGFICEYFYAEKRILVVQFLALACEKYREEILKALKKITKADAIFERSDSSAREKEGLPLVCDWIFGKAETDITICENNVKLTVDIKNGQKTGYFLDQKFNRKRVAQFCKDKTVLDTFTHTGAFGLNAFLAGAKEVTSVDISDSAIATVNKNIELNNAGKVVKAVEADVFDLLKQYENEGRKFDVIILDPPAFTKSAKMIEKAYGGYKEINLRAMRLLNEDGILVTCSCSSFMTPEMFCDMIMHAACDSHKKVQIIEKRGAGSDHPVLCGYPKSEYLKCVICRVI